MSKKNGIFKLRNAPVFPRLYGHIYTFKPYFFDFAFPVSDLI